MGCLSSRGRCVCRIGDGVFPDEVWLGCRIEEGVVTGYRIGEGVVPDLVKLPNKLTFLILITLNLQHKNIIKLNQYIFVFVLLKSEQAVRLTYCVLNRKRII